MRSNVLTDVYKNILYFRIYPIYKIIITRNFFLVVIFKIVISNVQSILGILNKTWKIIFLSSDIKLLFNFIICHIIFVYYSITLHNFKYLYIIDLFIEYVVYGTDLLLFF